MTKAKRKRIMKYRQKQLNQMFAYLLIMNICIVLMIVFTAMIGISGNNKREGEDYLTIYESNDHNIVNSSANVLSNNLE